MLIYFSTLVETHLSSFFKVIGKPISTPSWHLSSSKGGLAPVSIFSIDISMFPFSLPLCFSKKYQFVWGRTPRTLNPFEPLSSLQVKSVDGQGEPTQANCQLLCQGHSYLRTILQFILPISQDSYLGIYYFQFYSFSVFFSQSQYCC